MEMEEFLPFNFLMAFQTVLEVLEFKLEQNWFQQFHLAFFTVLLEAVCI